MEFKYIICVCVEAFNGLSCVVIGWICIMIYRCRDSGQSGQDGRVRNIHGWQKNSLHSCGWINQKCQTPDGCDLAGSSLCRCWCFFLWWLKGYFYDNFFPSSSDREADVLSNGYTRSWTQPLLFLASGTDQLRYFPPVSVDRSFLPRVKT